MDRRYQTPEKVTVEKIRSYPGCEKLTDEEAKEILESLEKLANMLFSTIRKSKIEKDK